MQLCACVPCFFACSSYQMSFKERRSVKRTESIYLLLVLLPAWDLCLVESLLQGGFAFKFIGRHALSLQPWSAHAGNSKGCVHVRFLPRLQANRGLLFHHKFIATFELGITRCGSDALRNTKCTSFTFYGAVTISYFL